MFPSKKKKNIETQQQTNSFTTFHMFFLDDMFNTRSGVALGHPFLGRNAGAVDPSHGGDLYVLDPGQHSWMATCCAVVGWDGRRGNINLIETPRRYKGLSSGSLCWVIGSKWNFWCDNSELKSGASLTRTRVSPSRYSQVLWWFPGHAVTPNVISYNAAISCCQWPMALQLLEDMDMKRSSGQIWRSEFDSYTCKLFWICRGSGSFHQFDPCRSGDVSNKVLKNTWKFQLSSESKLLQFCKHCNMFQHVSTCWTQLKKSPPHKSATRYRSHSDHVRCFDELLRLAVGTGAVWDLEKQARDY